MTAAPSVLADPVRPRLYLPHERRRRIRHGCHREEDRCGARWLPRLKGRRSLVSPTRSSPDWSGRNKREGAGMTDPSPESAVNLDLQGLQALIDLLAARRFHGPRPDGPRRRHRARPVCRSTTCPAAGATRRSRAATGCAAATTTRCSATPPTRSAGSRAVPVPRALWQGTGTRTASPSDAGARHGSSRRAAVRPARHPLLRPARDRHPRPGAAGPGDHGRPLRGPARGRVPRHGRRAPTRAAPASASRWAPAPGRTRATTSRSPSCSTAAHRFLVEVGSERGAGVLLDRLPRDRRGRATTCRRRPRSSSASRGTDGPARWTPTTSATCSTRTPSTPAGTTSPARCLSCGNCTMVCPTCFCTSVEDHTALAGDDAERWRVWDSCFTSDFSYLHGGSVRSSPQSRYRQWMTHKLASWIDQFGTSGCVGCGRCVTWCPVGIDITEEAAAHPRRSAARREPRERADMQTVRAAPDGAPVLRRARRRDRRAARGLREQRPLPAPGSTSSARASRPTASSSSGRGRVALEVHSPAAASRWSTPSRTGDVVGWSWLVPPYRWFFDARAVDGRVRGRLRRRLPARQVRRGPGPGLRADAAGRAGDVPAAAVRPRPAARPLRSRPCRADRSRAGVRRGGPDAAAAVPGRRIRQDTRDTYTLELEPLDGAALQFAAGQFTMLQAFGVGEVPISISGDPAAPDRLEHTIRDVGGVTAALWRRGPATCSGVRGPFGTRLGRRRTASAATSSSSPAASASHRCGRRIARGARGTAQDYGRVSAALRRPDRRTTCSFTRRARGAGRRARTSTCEVTVDRAARLARPRRAGHPADPARPLRRRQHPGAASAAPR